jgi:hypothetical protein
VEEALDKVALLVQRAIEASFVCSLFSWRNDSFEFADFELVENGVRVVASVAKTRFARDKVDELVGDGAVVLLTWSKSDLQWPTLQIDDGVNLRRETASRTANFVFLGPPRPPDAS